MVLIITINLIIYKKIVKKQKDWLQIVDFSRVWGLVGGRSEIFANCTGDGAALQPAGCREGERGEPLPGRCQRGCQVWLEGGKRLGNDGRSRNREHFVTATTHVIEDLLA